MKNEQLIEILQAGDPEREVQIRIDDVDEGHTYTRKVRKVYTDRGITIIEGELGI